MTKEILFSSQKTTIFTVGAKKLVSVGSRFRVLPSELILEVHPQRVIISRNEAFERSITVNSGLNFQPTCTEALTRLISSLCLKRCATRSQPRQRSRHIHSIRNFLICSH